MIKVTMTLQAQNKPAFLDSVQQTDLKLQIIDSVTQDQHDLYTMEILGLNAVADIRFVVMLTFLRENRIAFSIDWENLDGDDGGEFHFRINPNDEQYLSWTYCQKNVVDIESVRAAILDGETRLFELLDSKEREFIPWDWYPVAA